MIRIGCHISTKKGYLGAAKEATTLDAEAFQYFPKNPRTLQIKTVDHARMKRCAAWCQSHNLVSVGHGPYGANLAAPGNLAVQTALSTLNDLQITDACGSLGVVIHFGTLQSGDPLEGYKNMIACLNQILTVWTGKAKILLENLAGNRGRMGTTLEELLKVRSLTNFPQKIGFCLDTCHLYASGQWRENRWEQLAERAEKIGFWDHVKVIHLNDAVYPSGSCQDRHAPLGKGTIGEKQLKQFLTTSALKNIPLILETPNKMGFDHRTQMQFAKQLIKS